MTSYVDVETSAEALLEDEELIDAVNEMVEVAANAIYEDLKNDVSGVLARIHYVVSRFFPFLVDWRNDPTIFWDDMEKLALAFLLYALSFLLLAPSSRWNPGKSISKAKRTRSSIFAFLSSENRKAFFHFWKRPFWKRDGLANSPGSHSKLLHNNSARYARRRLERSHSTSSIMVQGIKRRGSLAFFERRDDDEEDDDEEEEEEEEETEEEKFAKRWSDILETRYVYLVLPPQCKRVEKPKNKRYPKVPSSNKIASKKMENPDVKSDEENPAQRLQYYSRQFLHLIMSFLKYDYVGAGWTLIHWFELCLRSRRQQQSQAEEEESENGEATIVNVLTMDSVLTTGASSPRGDNSSASTTPQPQLPAIVTITPSSSKLKMRSKRDNLLKHKPDLGFPPVPVGVDEECNDAVDAQPHDGLSSQTARPIGSVPMWRGDYRDEKKEQFSLDEQIRPRMEATSPPQTPLRSTDLKQYSDTMYETNGPSVQDGPEACLDSNSEYAVKRTKTNSNRNDGTHCPKDTNPGINGMSPFYSPARSEWREPRNDTPGSPYPPPRATWPRAGTIPPIPEPATNKERTESVDATFYFETVSTNECLKRMAVELPVPDRNGYIVGDDFLPDQSKWMPLLVFVNSRSGPQQGHLLITQLRGLLNPVQVWDLADGGPEEILESFATSLSRLRILVCGGDGTVSWIVSAIEKMKLPKCPPIAILPLGTGNDLARIHGWGGGYNNESLIEILEQVAESYVSWLDQWEITISNKKGQVKETKSFFNYLGVGADAQAALQVHLLRESRPQLFFSRLVNKAWYGVFGAEEFVKATSVNLPHEITLFADGVEIPLPEDSQGIILLNIDSYAGGVPLWSMGDNIRSPMASRENSWLGPRAIQRSRSLSTIKDAQGSMSGRMTGKETEQANREDSVENLTAMMKQLSDEEKFQRVTACDRPSSCQDGFLDVVSVRGAFHLGQIKVGLSTPQRLCQCREAVIVIKRKVPVQIDGEPWRQNVCTLRVRRKKDATRMLHRSENEGNGVETEVAHLLDWAEDKKLIDDNVHDALMKEFSRRIENKNRERRELNNRSGTFSLKRAIASTSTLGPSKGCAPAAPAGIMF